MELEEILKKFLNHFNFLISENNNGELAAEYRHLKEAGTEIVANAEEYARITGSVPKNRAKNRYKDIIPFDSSRVTLKELPGVIHSDYINANYVKGIHGSPAYIAAQAPLPNTINDFWRMVWETDVKVILMACNEFEAGKKSTDVRDNGDLIIRRLQVQCEENSRTVMQYHYTAWPDHGIPHSMVPILDMLHSARTYQAGDEPPIIVHCSAGCGRTGTLIAIDYVWNLLKCGKMTEELSILDILIDMRKQRQSLVQTTDQYEVVYRAIIELFQRQIQTDANHIYENFSSEQKAAKFKSKQSIAQTEAPNPSPQVLRATLWAAETPPQLMEAAPQVTQTEKTYTVLPTDDHSTKILFHGTPPRSKHASAKQADYVNVALAEPTPKPIIPESTPKAIIPESTPRQVAPESRPNQVTSESRPKQVTPESRPKQISPESRPNQVAHESRPKQLAHESRPNQLISESIPKSVTPEMQPKHRTLGSSKNSSVIRMGYTSPMDELKFRFSGSSPSGVGTGKTLKPEILSLKPQSSEKPTSSKPPALKPPALKPPALKPPVIARTHGNPKQPGMSKPSIPVKPKNASFTLSTAHDTEYSLAEDIVPGHRSLPSPLQTKGNNLLSLVSELDNNLSIQQTKQKSFRNALTKFDQVKLGSLHSGVVSITPILPCSNSEDQRPQAGRVMYASADVDAGTKDGSVYKMAAEMTDVTTEDKVLSPEEGDEYSYASVKDVNSWAFQGQLEGCVGAEEEYSLQGELEPISPTANLHSTADYSLADDENDPMYAACPPVPCKTAAAFKSLDDENESEYAAVDTSPKLQVGSITQPSTSNTLLGGVKAIKDKLKIGGKAKLPVSDVRRGSNTSNISNMSVSQEFMYRGMNMAYPNRTPRLQGEKSTPLSFKR